MAGSPGFGVSHNVVEVGSRQSAPRLTCGRHSQPGSVRTQHQETGGFCIHGSDDFISIFSSRRQDAASHQVKIDRETSLCQLLYAQIAVEPVGQEHASIG